MKIRTTKEAVMRYLVIVILLCFCLSGCTYSSANLIRAQGGKVTVFWGTGFVHCVNSALTFYRSMDTTSEKKDDFPKLPVRPTISEAGQGGQVNIGKATKLESVAPSTDNSIPNIPITQQGG